MSKTSMPAYSVRPGACTVSQWFDVASFLPRTEVTTTLRISTYCSTRSDAQMWESAPLLVTSSCRQAAQARRAEVGEPPGMWWLDWISGMVFTNGVGRPVPVVAASHIWVPME